MGAFRFKYLVLVTAALSTAALGQVTDEVVNDSASSTIAMPKIDSAIFAANSRISRPVLSPDGNAVAFVSYPQNKEAMLVVSFDGSKKAAIAVPEKMDLNWYRWAGNGRVIISFSEVINFEGEEYNRSALVAYDIASKTSSFIGKRTQGFSGDDLIYVHPSGDWGLLALQESIYNYPSVHRVDFATGKMKREIGERPPIWNWFADSTGVVRGGVGTRSGAMQFHYRSNASEPFEAILKSKLDVDHDADFLFSSVLGAGPDEGFVLARDGNRRTALYRFNFAELKLKERIFGSDKYDLNDFVMKKDGSGPLVAYYTADYDEAKWFDPAYEAVQANIDKALGKRKGTIVSTSDDNSTLLVHVGASNNLGSFYYFKVAEGVMHNLGRLFDNIKPSQLAATQSVAYKARDGLEIPAYLTIPSGQQKNLPLIILPHGGPYGIRDDMEYDPEVQFLVNRGYAVLQPNFRGSGGYGKKFEEAGDGEYGRKMQDDLDDGMDWLARQGTIDPKRVCVVGSSYGGYAAMWAVTRNPERYRCAASFAGVSDLKRQMKYSQRNMYGKNRGRWQMTVEGEEKFDLDQVSALPQVARLTRPVLLAHGEDDTRVRVIQSKA